MQNRIPDPALTRSADDVVARLRSGLPDERYDFRVTIVDDTLVNALAVPGGAMLVFRGLIRNSASPEDRIDSRGMISFFDTLERIAGPGSPMLTYLSTHPRDR